MFNNAVGAEKPEVTTPQNEPNVETPETQPMEA